VALLIENGRIIDGTGAQPMEGGVLIDGERIVAVGRDAVAAAQRREQVDRLDAAGCTVMPGLIDVHCHVTLGEPASNDELFFHRSPAYATLLAAWNIGKLLRAGVTSCFDVDGLFEIGPALRDGITAGIVEGPRMVAGTHALLTAVGGTAGRLIPDRGTIGYAEVVTSKDEMVRVVRRQIKHGADWIKIHATGLIPGHSGEIQVWSQSELRLVCETAHALGIPVCAHTRNASSAKDAALAGVDLLFHCTHLDDDAVEVIAKAGIPIAPTMTFLANLVDYGPRVGASPQAIDLFRAELEQSRRTLRALYDAGNRFMCGSETGFSITPNGHWHARELELLVRYLEISPLDAIRCGTHNGAAVMGKLAEHVGTLQVGKLADIIIVDGNPLESLAVLSDRRRLRHVFKGGRAVDLARPWPERTVFPREQVLTYGDRPLTWELVHGDEQLGSAHTSDRPYGGAAR
jgi:imidazolonepropionase-like amidohydrolase